MPRPRRPRRIQGPVESLLFKPQGIPLTELKGVVLSHDALEALRLADAEELDQENAAKLMGISRPTFSRLVAEARHIVATALINRWALRIDGGDYWVDGDSPLDERCSNRGRKRQRCGRRR
ncbi:MAG: DUF134 domain-containing protein [Rhodospirillales bacterium]|jgi:uncharacterized protein|nr:DUF134 domain-containing protein [Rhodospirillales bacterium]